MFYASTMKEYAKLPSYCHEKIRYGCARCNKNYGQKKTLGRHMKFECGQKPTFSCTVCFKKYRHGYILLKHMRTTHDINIQKLRNRGVKSEEEEEEEIITVSPDIDF